MEDKKVAFISEEEYDKLLLDANEASSMYNLENLTIEEKEKIVTGVVKDRKFNSEEEKTIFIINFLIPNSEKFYNDYLASGKNATSLAKAYNASSSWIFSKVFEICKYENYVFKKEKGISKIEPMEIEKEPNGLIIEEKKETEVVDEKSNTIAPEVIIEETKPVIIDETLAEAQSIVEEKKGDEEMDQVIEIKNPEMVEELQTEIKKETSSFISKYNQLLERNNSKEIVITNQTKVIEIKNPEMVEELQTEIKKETSSFISKYNQLLESNNSKEIVITNQTKVIENQQGEIANLEEVNGQLKSDNERKDKLISEQSKTISDKETEISRLEKELKIYKDAHEEVLGFFTNQEKENILIK